MAMFKPKMPVFRNVFTGFTALVLVASGIFARSKTQEDWANWMLDALMLCTTLVISWIGCALSQEDNNRQHKSAYLTEELNKCRTLLETWAAHGDDAVITIERELHDTIKSFPELHPLADAVTRAERLHGKVLLLVSGSGELKGQPTSSQVHQAKQHINCWAEDVCQVFTESSIRDPKTNQLNVVLQKPHSNFLPLFQQRARSFMLFAEPLNYAWHYHNNTNAAAGNPTVKARERLAIMWYLAEDGGVPGGAAAGASAWCCWGQCLVARRESSH
jgi:hypothetical protein